MNTQTELSQPLLKRIRIAVFTFYFMQGLCFSSWASRIPDIKNLLGLDDAAWGTLLLMIPVGQICGMSISGFLVSKIGSRPILRYVFLGYALALVGIGFAPTQYSLIVSLIVFGFFGNFCNISINTQGVNVETLYKRQIMATFHGGWSLAGLTGACIGLLMSAFRVEPGYHFIFVALVVLVGYTISFRYLQPDIKKKQVKADGQEKGMVLPEKFLFLLGMVAFCGMAAEGAMADWSGLYLTDVVGISERFAPIGLVAYMITMSMGRFFIDKATNRWGRRRVIQSGGALIASGLFLAVAIPHPIATLIAFMIIGAGTCGIVPSIYSVVGQKTRIPTSIALTITSSISFLGFLLGPPVIGYISHVTNLRYSYAMIGVFGLCIILLSSRIKVLRE